MPLKRPWWCWRISGKRVLAAMASVSREEYGVEGLMGGGAGVPIEREHYQNMRRTDAGATCCRQAAHVRGCPFVAHGPKGPSCAPRNRGAITTEQSSGRLDVFLTPA